MGHDTARHRHGQCVDDAGQRYSWCLCWWDGWDAGYRDGIAYGTAHPDEATVEQAARDWLAADSAALARDVAERIGPGHDERRAREAAGRGRARARIAEAGAERRAAGGDAA